MHKKSDTYELDYPRDDIDCWERYTRYHWVYDLSRLLDAQNIKWSPFEVKSLPDRELNIELISNDAIVRQPGYVYLKKPYGPYVITEIHIIKGEVKNMRQFDPVTSDELESFIGEIELRINAFVTLHFQKFTGVISADMYSNEIFRIRLRPYTDPQNEANADVLKLIKRIYKRTELNVSNRIYDRYPEPTTSV
jgi:hypothetical protein